MKIPITPSNKHCPTDAFSQKSKKNYQKEKLNKKGVLSRAFLKKKSRYSDLFLISIVQTPPREPHKLGFVQTD
jgi:hypothetical protein